MPLPATAKFAIQSRVTLWTRLRHEFAHAFALHPIEKDLTLDDLALLKKVAARYLPPAAVTSRKKGFSAPLLNWFEPHLDQWNRKLLDGGLLQQRNILRPDWMSRLASLRERQPRIGARARWLLLAAELWARRWIAGDKTNPIT